MIKPNSVLRRKWFQIAAVGTASFVIAGGAIGGGVAAAIVNVATQRAKDTISDLGITPDPDTKSNIDKNLLADPLKKVNVVSLGDSVTAGFTTLDYVKEQTVAKADGTAETVQIPVTPSADGNTESASYADYVANKLSNAGKLGTYNRLAVSGQTSSGLLETLTKAENIAVIGKADLVMLTVGANDILKAINILGVPYSQFPKILANPSGSFSLSSGTGQVQDSTKPANPWTGLIPDDAATRINYYSYLPALFASLQDIMTNGPEKLFSVDPKVLDVQLVNALSNVLKALTFIHKISPGAKIILSEYQFPFNRYVHNGVNITEVETSSLADVTFNGKPINKNTLRGVYDYVMDNFKDKATAAFGAVTWNSLQDDQDALIEKLLTVKDEATSKPVVATKEEAVALFQKDIADIHPTEYSHALIGQHMFNTYLSPYLGVPTQDDKFDSLRKAIAGAKLPAKSTPLTLFIQFILNSKKDTSGNLTGPYEFARLFVDDIVEEMKVATNAVSLDKIDLSDDKTRLAFFNTSFLTMLSNLMPLLAGAATEEQTTKFTVAFDSFINKIMFNPNKKTVFNSFVLANDILPSKEFTRSAAHNADFYGLLGKAAAEAALARVAPLTTFNVKSIQTFAGAALALAAADKRTLENAMGLAANVLDKTLAEVVGYLYGWVNAKLSLPGGTDPYPGAPATIKTALVSFVSSVKNSAILNTVYFEAAQKLIALSDADKAAFKASFNNSNEVSLLDVSNVVMMLSGTLSASNTSLPADEKNYLNMPDAAKPILGDLIAKLNDAVAYANALARAFPAAFFTNYETNGMVRVLGLNDLKRTIAPSFAGQLGPITLPAAS